MIQYLGVVFCRMRTLAPGIYGKLPYLVYTLECNHSRRRNPFEMIRFNIHAVKLVPEIDFLNGSVVTESIDFVPFD